MSIWPIAWMCFFWSMSSFIVCSLTPSFLMDVLNASHKSVGFMESFALFSAFGAKLFSGVLSDYFKKRKPLIIFGTCATLLGKIGFFYASSVIHVFFARSWDRFAKGIRSTPTDALIADCSTSKNRAQSYGARQMLYSLGNVAGGLTATCLMYLTSKNYRLIFLLSLIPALCGLFILIRSITDAPYLKRIPWKWRDATKLPKPFWIVMGIMFFLMMGRFSNAFINLRIKEVGWPVEAVPVLLCIFELVFACVVLPIGRWADQGNKSKIFFVGILVLTCADTLMVLFPQSILIGIVLIGVHFGLTEGVVASFIANFTPDHLRGTAFGLFYIIGGFAAFLGNNIAGFLSDLVHSTSGALYSGILFTLLSAIFLLVHKKKIIS